MTVKRGNRGPFHFNRSGGKPGDGPTASASFLLMENGTDEFLLENGTDLLLLEV